MLHFHRFMNLHSKIYVSGHLGMVGRAITKRLQNEGYKNLILKTRAELDLLNQSEVRKFFEDERPEYVFLAAAKVGGIWKNLRQKADFITENLSIQTNVIHHAHLVGVKKLLFLGSSCIYPKLAEQPIREQALLTGPLEETNDAYAIAKIAGMMMCRAYRQQYGSNFISLMPTNLYGPHDNFHPEDSHVLPAMIHKFHQAKANSFPSVSLWGSGAPCREFLHVDDLADACIHFMHCYNNESWVNIGAGKDIQISDLARLVQRVVGYKGKLVWDRSKPGGTPKKLLNLDLANSFGWKSRIPLEEGIRHTYSWFIENEGKRR